MQKNIARLNKVIGIAIFLAVQTLPTNTIFADLPINHTYIVSPGYPGMEGASPQPFSAKGAERARFDAIEKVLKALVRKEAAIYNEYLVLAKSAHETPERLEKIYVEKMRKTSQNFMAYLKKALSLAVEKDEKSLAFISQDEHAFKALFLLDRR